jgi:hypothetical protein
VIVGGFFHFTDLGTSNVDQLQPGFTNAQPLQAVLDRETGHLADPEIYGEASLGWLF